MPKLQSPAAPAPSIGEAVPPNIPGDQVRIFRGDPRGNFRGNSTRPLAFEITTDDWNKISADAMRAHVGNDKGAAKVLAEKIGCSPRTAENYLQARSAPQGVHHVRAIAAIPEFAAAERYVSGLEADLDPDAERARIELMRAAQAYVDARERAAEAGREAHNANSGASAHARAAGEPGTADTTPPSPVSCPIPKRED